MTETIISTIIINSFTEKLKKMQSSDVIIAGSGPSGLIAAIKLAQNGFKPIIFESDNKPGGGIWGGGMMFNNIVLSNEHIGILKEYNIKYELHDNLVSVDSIHFASSLIYIATSLNVLLFNNIEVEDVIVLKERVSGAVINWQPVVKNHMHIDPLMVCSEFLIDATGHPASIASLLAKRGLLDIKQEFPLDVNIAEQFVVNATEEIYPGLIITGMAATTVKGGPRMGPIFSGMINSGIKASEIIRKQKRINK